MPLDRKKKLLFIHIPKVAGTSIEKALGLYGKHFESSLELAFGKYTTNGETYALQHIGYDQYVSLGILEDEEIKSYFSFCFVRNPWDRAVSDYKWQKNIRKRKLTFREFLKESNQIIQKYENSRLINYTNCHYVPQSWYIYDKEGDTNLNFIGKYENLDNDLQSVLKQLDISDFALQSSNQGKMIPYFFYYYDVRNISLVCKMYKEDIKRFNYYFLKSNAARVAIKRVFKKIYTKSK